MSIKEDNPDLKVCMKEDNPDLKMCIKEDNPDLKISREIVSSERWRNHFVI